MKSVMKRLIGDEKGAAMFLVLILLLIGGLITTPLLAHMGTGLIGGEVYERRGAELYAADAGVEDAVWKIQRGKVPVCSGDPSRSYNMTDVNGKSVEYTIEYMGEGIYKITSIAITDDGGGTAAISGTQIEAYVIAVSSDFSGFLDNAITSGDDITIRGNKTGVSGNVSLPPDGELDPPDFDPENGEVKREELVWPTGEEIADFYWPEVEHLTPVPDGYEIDIPSGTTADNPYVIESLSAAGSLTIKGEGWIEIGGTIYVKGDLVFNAHPVMNVNLNQQTIFAEGDIYIPPKVNISGSGCIIAVEDVQFNPNISSGNEDFVLIMSVEGTIQLNPGSDFYGAIVGNIDVTLQPNITLSWLSPEGKGLNFPGADPNDSSKWIWKINTWEVNHLPR